MSLYDFFYSKKYFIFRHIAFWVFFYIDEYLSILGITEHMGLIEIFKSILPDLILVYINLYYLIPHFFQKDKIPHYLIFTGISIIISVCLTVWLYYEPCEECFIFYDFVQAGLYATGVLGIAVAIKISKITYQKQQKINELLKLQHTSEINYLKKQVNPHFLFNVLNNMYVQSKDSPKEVPETILKLSDLMRYQTYDAAKDQVSLNKEIEFIKQYLDLEKLRRDNLEVNLNIAGEPNNITISPLIYLPFVENACKHSAQSLDGKDKIDLQWTIENNNLKFEIKNTIGMRSGHLNDNEYRGFGLENVRKRIALLYPNSHTLDISEQNNVYQVTFKINLI